MDRFRSCLKIIRHGLQRARQEITDRETGTVFIDRDRACMVGMRPPHHKITPCRVFCVSYVQGWRFAETCRQSSKTVTLSSLFDMLWSWLCLQNSCRVTPRQSALLIADGDYDEFDVQVVQFKPSNLDDLCHLTRYSREEIKLIYRGFKQECPSGVVDEESFKELYGQFYPLGGNCFR